MFLSNLVQKAQQYIDPAVLPASLVTATTTKPSKSVLFQQQFHLPSNQNPLYEITAELTLPTRKASSSKSPSSKQQQRWGPNDWDKGADGKGTHYVGQLHLSEQYLCFSTVNSSFVSTASTSASSAFTGRTHGTGTAGNGFTLPLCAVRRVERLHTQSYMFALSITTWNGFDPGTDTKPGAPAPPKLTIQLEGSRQQCERFCDGLKRGLRQGIREVENMRAVAAECYSEYFMYSDFDGPSPTTKADGVTPRHLPDTGLGSIFKYPGNSRKLRDRSKMRLWHEYMRENGRNTTLVRQPDFHRLIRVGLPNLLRGEMWELTSGSLYLRLQKPKLYGETLKKHEGEESLAIDEIEKDLNRSLPEYAGFQSEDGIGRLRRVLTAYSWTNVDVGYCQAMNIVVAALLMYVVCSLQSVLDALLTYCNRYLSETQAFYVLSILCDRLLPGYYSTTMYGTLLDQKVFESLVEKTMPVLWEHLSGNDVQLSVVSLPWFLSLYINSMPLIFAFRVLDVFFLEGPKVLFQVGLAILRVNGEELLDATDDGAFISVLKSYFARLGESAHPKSENPKHRAITNFQALMVVAFKEFDGITQHTISEQRSKHKAAVLENIESFAKRTSIRNLGPESKKLSTNDLGFLYDRFYTILYERQQRAQVLQADEDRKRKASRQRATEIVTGVHGNGAPEMGRVGLGPSTTEMDYDAFREFLAGVAKWAVTDSPSSPTSANDPSAHKSANGYFHTLRAKPSQPSSPWGIGPEPAEHEFLRRLFKRWDKEVKSSLTLQDVVAGLAPITGGRDIMGNISYFFELYDNDNDGKVDREGILRMSEALLFLSRRGVEGGGLLSPSPSSASISEHEEGKRRETKDEQFLSAVSSFIRRCFEYADPDHASRKAEMEANGVAQQVDLLGLSNGDESAGSDQLAASSSSTGDVKDDSVLSRPSTNAFGQVQTKARHVAANAALDPSSPVHITLPTFRMLVLADEPLESFFDSGFANSFHLADAPLPSSTITSPTFLGGSSSTASLPNIPDIPAMSPGGSSGVVGGAGAGVVPPGKGLRGMLDNIVTDGMRVAAEVRRRMDEAQKELDKGASTRGTEDDDDDDGDEGGRDLLEGAEADAGEGRRGTGVSREPSLLDQPLVEEPKQGSSKEEVEKSTMFER